MTDPTPPATPAAARPPALSPPWRVPRIVAALTVLACVLAALVSAAPLYYFCEGTPGHYVCGPSINRGTATDDGRYFAFTWEAARVSLQEFHEFPSWNPYHCGGIVLYQDPQAPFPGPLFLLLFFWLPAVVGIKVWEISHLVVGALGARALAKDMGANAPEQFLCAVVCTACGFMAWHIGGGHLSFTPFQFLPWILWAWRRSLREPRWALLVAALFAVAFYEGATYPVPLMLVAVGLDTLPRLARRDERRALAFTLPIFGVFFPLLAAARLLPILHYLGEHPRLVPLDDHMSVAEVFETWITRQHDRPYPGHVFVWNEFGDYVGLIPVVLMLVGLGVALVRRDEQTRARRIDAFLLIGLVCFALGNQPGFSAYGLLHLLPIFKSLRVPSRFLYTCTVAMAAVMVWGLSAARGSMDELHFRRWITRAFVAFECVLGLAALGDMCSVNWTYIQLGVDPELPRVAAPRAFHQDFGADYSRLATHPARGIGTSACYVAVEWASPPGLWSGNGPQFRLEPSTAGSASQTRWSPNAIDFDVNLASPARLVVNQHMETGWHASVGSVADDNGLIAVTLPAGHNAVRVSHSPPWLAPGVALFVLGLVAAFALLRLLTPARADAIRAWVARHARTASPR